MRYSEPDWKKKLKIRKRNRQMKIKNLHRRFKRSLRAVSPVIAVLLMIVIAVAAALFAYAWVMGYLDFLTVRVDQGVQVQAINWDETAGTSGWLTAYAQNVGQSSVTIANVYVDDQLVLSEHLSFDPSNVVNATQTVTIGIDNEGGYYGGAAQVTVKVATGDGNIYQLKKTVTTTSGGGGVIPTIRYRKPITINGVVGGPHTDFPVLVTISGDTDIGGNTGASGGSADGDHIYFTDSDGTTKLDHEIESFSVSGGAASLVAWVRVPSLSAGKVIYLYYGSAVAGGQENPIGVWNSNYAAVYHLSETGTNTRADSTNNGNDGTPVGSVADTTHTNTDGADDFNGNDYIEAANSGSLSIGGNQITLSAMVRFTDTGSAEIIIAKPWQSSTHSSPYFAYSLHLLDSGSNVAHARLWIRTSGGTGTAETGNINANTWYYIVGTYDGSNVRVYINGAPSASGSRTGNIETRTTPLRIGTNGGYGEDFSGNLDEVRISSIARSGDWITTEYSNMNNPGGFYSIGSEEII
jgi:FlaG/FlaF family flagellin (archaellin)